MHAAAVGDALIAPNITRRLLSTLAATGPSKRRTQPIEPLTEREEEALALVARGRTNATAADPSIGLTTAETYVASLLTKIGAATGSRSRCGPTHRPGGEKAAVQGLEGAVQPSTQAMKAVSLQRCAASRQPPTRLAFGSCRASVVGPARPGSLVR